MNNERRVVDSLGVRIGLGGIGVQGAINESVFFIPMTASWLGLRSGQHGLEVGAGVTLVEHRSSANWRMSSPVGTALVG